MIINARASFAPVFLKGSLAAHILRMTIASHTALFVVQIADMLALVYVSNTGTPAQVSGLGVAMTIFFLGFVVNLAGSTTVSATVAQASVKNDELVLRTKVVTSIAWQIIGGIVSTVLILLLMRPAFSLLGIDGETRNVAIGYLTILAPINGVVALSMGCSATMRGLGRAKDAMMITLLGGVINLVADPILIILLKMGPDGAAVGVWIGRLAQGVFALFLFSRLHLLQIPSFRVWIGEFSNYIRIAGPAAIAGVAPPLGGAFLIYIIGMFGDNARAAVFTVEKVAVFAFGFAMTMANSIGSIAAQNFAANQRLRTRNVFLLFLLFAGIFVTAVAIIIFACRSQIIRLYDINNSEVEALSMHYLMVCSLSSFAAAVINGSVAMFQNCRRPSYSIYINWARVTIGMCPCWIFAVSFRSAEAAINGFVFGQLFIAAIVVPMVFVNFGHNYQQASQRRNST